MTKVIARAHSIKVPYNSVLILLSAHKFERILKKTTFKTYSVTHITERATYRVHVRV